MRRAPVLAVAVLLATLLAQSAGAVVKGDERVLVVLATSGPKPYTVGDVEQTAAQAGDFFSTASFGQVRLRVDVTPWLPAFDGNPGCGGGTNRSLENVVAPARLAADQAGFDASRYDDVIYTIADSHCGFHGVTWGHEVMLTRQPSLQLLVHELGHAFGLGHAQSSDCITAAGRITGGPVGLGGGGGGGFSGAGAAAGSSTCLRADVPSSIARRAGPTYIPDAGVGRSFGGGGVDAGAGTAARRAVRSDRSSGNSIPERNSLPSSEA